MPYRWYLSARAVREYAALARLGNPDDEAVFDRAESQLGAIAQKAHHLRDQANGLQLWRGGRPLRLRLLVSTAERAEGDLPQLVSVLAASERR